MSFFLLFFFWKQRGEVGSFFFFIFNVESSSFLPIVVALFSSPLSLSPSSSLSLSLSLRHDKHDAMLLALRRVAAAAAAASSSEATTMMRTTRIDRRRLFTAMSSSSSSSSSSATSTSSPPHPPPPSPDPSLHVQLEPISSPDDSVEGVFTLTLCRPSARNAVGRKLLSELRGCLEALAGESPTSARALVVRSAVPGVFCAGADLRERAAMTRLEARRFVEELRATVGLLEALPFPTICAVDGAALGGGAELALAADVRVVGPRASFGFPETRLGIIPG